MKGVIIFSVIYYITNPADMISLENTNDTKYDDPLVLTCGYDLIEKH